MLKVNIANTEFEYLAAVETEEFYNGANRRTLTLTCPSDAASVDTVNALLTEENLSSITLTNAEAQVCNIYDGYVLKLFCGIKCELTAAETPESAAVYEDRLVIKLGRRTYIEAQLASLGL